MTAKEKLANALNHQEGPLPVDLGSTAVTGMHCETVAAVRERLGLEKKPVKIVEPYQMLGEIDGELAEALGIDTLPLWDERTMVGVRLRDFKEWTTPWGQEVLVPGDFHCTMDEKGNVYLYPQGDAEVEPSLLMPSTGRFFDALDRQKPYDFDALTLADNTEEFSPIDDKTLTAMKNRADEIRRTGKGVVGNFGGTSFGDIALIPANGMKDPKGIRGVADWYMLLATDPGFVRSIFDVQLEVALQNLEKIYTVVGETPDVVCSFGTDFGTQIGTFCSLEAFRTLYKPYYAAVTDWIHSHTSWKVFMHSCGAIEPFLSDVIDAGCDIVNPVQWMAAGMDRALLKNQYGDRIVFWGGGINTQKTLPFGDAKEVYDEARECCRIFGKNGGYVFNAVHNIQAKVPAENVVALFQAVQDHNRG